MPMRTKQRRTKQRKTRNKRTRTIYGGRPGGAGGPAMGGLGRGIGPKRAKLSAN